MSYLDSAIKPLNDGLVGIMLCDTVYGIVCSAHNKQATQKLYGLKSRVNKPGTLIASNVDQLIELGFDESILKKAQPFWPNPISIEVPCDSKYASKRNYLHLGTGAQAVRIPNNHDLLALLDITGPLQTTSANPPGDPTANSIEEAKAYFGDQVDFYIENPAELFNPNAEASAVIKIEDDKILVFRNNSVLDKIETDLKKVIV
jgi:L-threonylcarbamoyladenylate synthase